MSRRLRAGRGSAPARVFALFGGKGSLNHHILDAGSIDVFDVDRRGQRALLAAIRTGRVRAVLILTRFLGHGDSAPVVSLCRARGLPCLQVPGVLAPGVVGFLTQE